jgi:pyruvate dehydrogenase E1 component beta subunit
MREEMARDPRIFVLGTDLYERGGNFAQLGGLGQSRARPRPRHHLRGGDGVAGVGAALNGMRPVVDLNFAISLGAMDEIVNQAAKMRYMIGAPVLLVIRASGGVALFAAQHNNSLEGVFASFPGLLVACRRPLRHQGPHQVRAARRRPGRVPDALAAGRQPWRGRRSG